MNNKIGLNASKALSNTDLRTLFEIFNFNHYQLLHVSTFTCVYSFNMLLS